MIEETNQGNRNGQFQRSDKPMGVETSGFQFNFTKTNTTCQFLFQL